MAKYKLYQNKRAGKYVGKWYARAAHEDFVSTDAIAKRIQKNVSVKKSDVVAVLAELSEVMNAGIISGEKMRLEGIGTFKVGLQTSPADTAKEFSAARNIRRSYIIFTPEANPQRQARTSVSEKTLLSGLTWAEYGAYSVDKTTSANSSSGGGGSDNDMP